jgi:multidrug resistance efflux pump
LQSQLDGLRSRSTQRVQQGLREPIAEIPATKQALADLEQRLQRRLDELERLIVKAPAAGTFLPPRAQPKNVGKSELAMWTDTPLDPRNRGCHLETGTWLGLVGDPARLDATLLVEQAEVEFVRVGQHVTLHLDQQPAEFLRGAVCEISELDAEAAPPELIAAGLLPLRVAAQGTVRLARPYCRVRVTLAEHNLRVRPGAAGRARIHTAARSLGQRAVRYLEQIFDGRLWARATTPIRRSWPGNTRSERRILTSSNGTC